MIRMDAKLIKLTPRSIEEAIFVVRKVMISKVDKALSQQIAIGNNEFAITIDGKPAYSRDAIRFATKSIRVSFTAGIAEVAVSSAVGVLKGMLVRWYPFFGADGRSDAYKRISIESVTAWLNEKGKAPVEVSNSAKVVLTERQYITIAVKIPAGMINPIPLANFVSTRLNGTGFYERAARAVRRRLGVTKKTGAVRVAAVRVKSTKTIQPISDRKRSYKYSDKKPFKKHIPKDIATSTSWVIVIEPRRNNGQILRG